MRTFTRSVGDVRKVPTAPAIPPARIICQSVGSAFGSSDVARITASRIGSYSAILIDW